MMVYRKDEIVAKAAENNQLFLGERTPVQFAQDCYTEDWHIKAGTLAYFTVGTVPTTTTITISDEKESVECRIIAEMVACNATVYIDAIAYSNGTLLLQGEKGEPFLCTELFTPPSDSDLHTMRMYEEVNEKIVEDANAFDNKVIVAGVITVVLGLVLLILAACITPPVRGVSGELVPNAGFLTLTISGGVCFVMGIILPIFYDLFDCPAMENRKLSKEKKKLKEELKRRDAENVKAYEKGMI